MALRLQDVPADLDELGLTKIARVAFATRVSGHYHTLFSALVRELDNAKGVPSPETRRIDEIENLNFLTDQAANLLELLLKTFERINDQIEGVFEDEGITIDIS